MVKAELLTSSLVRLTQKGKAPQEVHLDKAPAGSIPQALINLAKRPPLSHDKPVACGPIWSYLLEHQQVGVQKIVHQFRGRCLLADDMGLGKTLQAVAVMLYYNVETVVVCPAFLKPGWERALAEWSAEATVVTYDKMRPSMRCNLVIVDEAHYLKNVHSQRTQNVLPVILQASHALLLSGTPCPNCPEELFVLLHGLRPQLVPSIEWFTSRYCNPRRTKFCARDTRGCDRANELAWLMQRAFQIRRTKSEVLPYLPPKTSEALHVEICPDVAKELQPLQAQYERAVSTGSQSAKSLIMSMYRMTARAKLTNAVHLAVHMLHGPTLIFAHHQVMLDAMEAALVHTAVGRIDGKMSIAKRQQVVDQFQSGQLQVLVLSMAAAGVGLTLTTAYTAFFLEIPWNAAILAQCEDRLHRIGQNNPCLIYYVLGNNTLDSYVWHTIHRKTKVCARLGL